MIPPYRPVLPRARTVMTVAAQSFSSSSTSLFQAKNEGYIEDVLTSPLRSWQLAFAYMSGGLLRGFTGAVAALAAPFAHEGAQPAITAVDNTTVSSLASASRPCVIRIHVCEKRRFKALPKRSRRGIAGAGFVKEPKGDKHRRFVSAR